jgi:gliding motility-associated-like protein
MPFLPKSFISVCLFFLLSFTINAQTNNYILIDEDQMETINVHIDGVISSSVNPFFDTPLGPTQGSQPNAPQGNYAFVINTKVSYTGLVFDKVVTCCPGASYYYKFFIGNEWTTSNLPTHGPSYTIKVVDALGTTLWTANYNNIQYASNEITTPTFIPSTSSFHFQIVSNLNNPPSGSGDGTYVNDGVFDDLRLYQNNPYYNYQTATGTSGVTFCSTDPTKNLADYLYWPMATGTWSGPSSLPNPNGAFNPASNTAGLYTFTNNNSSICPDTSSKINVIVNPAPNINPQVGINLPHCASFTLPSISGTNLPPFTSYYTGPNGTGTSYAPGTTITSNITLYAYAASGGCSDQETYNFYIAVPPNAGNDSTTQYCSSSSAVDLDNLIDTADAGTWYETSAIPSGQFNTSTAVLNVPGTSPGLYTFSHIVTGVFCPNDTAFVTITINNPVINTISNQTACESYTLPTISGSNLSGNQAYYSGSGGTGTIYHAGDNINSSTTLYAYDVSPTDASCSVEQSFSITIHQQNTAGNNFTASYCAAYGTLDLDTLITGQDAGGTWTNVNGATSFNTTNHTIDIASETDGDYVFQYFIGSTSPCVNDTSFVTIHVKNINISTIADTTVCEIFTLPAITGSNINSTAAYYTGASGTGTSYTAGNQINTSQLLYAYDVNPSDPACYSEKSFNLTINQQNTAGNNFSSTYCSTQGNLDLDSLLTGEDAGGTWTNVNGATSYNSTTNSISTGGETQGTYVFQYIINSSSPCVNDTAAVSITILEQASINMTVEDTLACFPGIFNFHAGTNSNPNYLYSWVFGNGATSNLENPNISMGSTGCFDVKLVVSNTGGMCLVADSVNNMVCVIPAPTAAFSTDQDTLSAENNVVTGTNSSTGATAYFWDFGDGANDTTFALNHAYSVTETGYLTIVLVATNVAGCSDTSNQEIFMLNNVTIELPNIFTPNGDGNNDIYTVNMQGVKHIEWNIVDRWGIVMLSGSNDTPTANQHFPIWDGGNAVDGVYFIVLKYTDVKGETKALQQHINLER